MNAAKMELLDEYTRLVALPNIYGDTKNIAQNAMFISGMLTRQGVQTRLLYGSDKTASPTVYGEVLTPGATTTIAFYAHYDGQPVNPAQWANGLHPFKPVLMTDLIEKGGKPVSLNTATAIQDQWRLYGRSAADDKAGVMQIINAYRMLKESALVPAINIKFFFEGEEEAGSINLASIMQENKALLQADLWVIADGPRHQSGKKQVLFGVRGDVNLSITLYGAKRPLHSGNYGNWAPNPAMRLSQLLASMKDKQGMVAIKGFYDDVVPLSETERTAIAAIPDIEGILKDELKIPVADGGNRSFMELMNLPTLNINGLQSANTGDAAANVIPSTATAVLDLRLVTGNDVDRQVEKVKAHIRAEGYHIIDHAPSDEERMQYPLIARIGQGKGYNAQRTSMDHPLAKEVVRAVQSTVAYPLILVPSIGGSLPLYLFEKHLGAKAITVTAVNYDNNQHAENENVRVGTLWEGIESMAAIMLMKTAAGQR